MKKIPVIIDCDPGHDDAIALMMALSSDLFDVRGITVVGGNQTLEKTTSNCLKVLSLLDKDIPVAQGAPGPMFKVLEVSESVHGDTGMDGPQLPDPKFSVVDMSAVCLMEKIISESSEPVTIIPMGPLTNVATFLLANPKLKSNIAQICLMGGSALIGNITPTAEFNIWQDPEAAHVVFNSKLPLVMHDIESTRIAALIDEDIEEIRSMNHVGKFVAELMDFFCIYSKEHGLPYSIHDACAVAYLIDPTIFTTKTVNVTVDIKGEKTYGCTVTDFRGFSQKSKNCVVSVDVDREKFAALVKKCVASYTK